MRGFGNLPLYVEMKDGFGAPGTFFGQATPTGIPSALGTISQRSVAHEINIGVILVSGPMKLEIVEEVGPIEFQAVGLEIPQRKRKAVIDPD